MCHSCRTCYDLCSGNDSKKREREIREFVPTPFYRVLAKVGKKPEEADNTTFDAEWKAVEGSIY